MPFALPIAAAMAPKAGAAVATAFAMGSDELIHQVDDHASALHDHATAFIELPISKARVWNMIIGPEVAAYNWVHSKFDLLSHKLFGVSDTVAVGPDQGRMVEYFATSCHHCKDLEPIWKNATGLWDQQSSEDAHKVVWEQKQCLDENWKPGPDYKECMAEHVQSFPSIKFFPPGSKTGEDFFLDRSPEQLVDFAKSGINPDSDVMPRAAGDEADAKLIDFYAAACPHCKHLDPIWDDAHKQWDKEIGQTLEAPKDELPLITFEKKQCYDDHWKPGPDHSECQRYHVDGFPTVKLFVPDPHGHGYVPHDYTGPRTPEGIVNFLKHESGVDEYLKALADEKAAAAAAPTDAAHHGGPIVGVQVPEEVRAAAAGHAEQQAGGADVQALQGSTPPMEDKALQAFQVEPQAPTAAPSSGKELPQALKEAVKTAAMPLPLLACLPIRKAIPSRASSQRCQVPPARAAQFI